MERDCTHWQAEFWRVLDGELPAKESATLSEHIRGCMDCRKMLVEAVAMHRKLLEVATMKQDLAVVAPVEIECAAQQCVPQRVMEPRRERVRPRVIVIDWRMIGAAEGFAEIRNALNFKSFER